MPAYYDDQTRNWFCKFYYEDYTGTQKQKKKRGFERRKDAQEWERNFLLKQTDDPTMPFKTLSELYLTDKKQHTKEITYRTKRDRVNNWILPYFNSQPINEITAADVRKWQGDLKEAKNAKDKPLSPGYMQNIVMELSSVFNYAVRFYGLSVNPCQIAGNTIGHKQKSLNFWTKDEFDRFISTFEPTDIYYTAFLALYYCGLRIGEFEALTAEDIDLPNRTIRINKTYHLIDGKRVITPPKTKKANRIIKIPQFLADLLKKYESRIYAMSPSNRLFLPSHSTYARLLEEHTKTAGIKRIRLHDLRHSHASLLIELGFSALLVSERLGHENVSTTLNIYSHLFPSKQSEVADKLDRLCKNNKY